MISHIFTVQFYGDGTLSPDGSQGFVDRTLPNLERTQGDHLRVKSLFRNSYILLRFEMRAAQSQLVLKLEFEVRTKWGAVGNLGFNQK